MRLSLLVALVTLCACATPAPPKPLTDPKEPPPKPAMEPQVDPTEGVELPMRAIGPIALVDGVKVSGIRFNIEVDKFQRRFRGRIPRRMLVNYKDKILDRGAAILAGPEAGKHRCPDPDFGEGRACRFLAGDGLQQRSDLHGVRNQDLLMPCCPVPTHPTPFGQDVPWS